MRIIRLWWIELKLASANRHFDRYQQLLRECEDDLRDMGVIP